MQIPKIVVIGPESTGKSTLCESLAQQYGTEWCPEFAREWLLTNGTDYDFNDLLAIAKGQLALEEEFTELMLSKNLPGKQPLFIDTNMYVMKVWCEFVFEKCHNFIIDEIVQRKYDLYLLCNTDLPWIQDELREYPDLETREKLYKMYKDLMINQETEWMEIRGKDDERVSQAIGEVNHFL